MLFWLTCSLLLFVVVELFDWCQTFTLPLPVAILAGVFLAIASNYRQIHRWRLTNLDHGIFISPPQLDSLPESTPVLSSIVGAIEPPQQSPGE